MCGSSKFDSVVYNTKSVSFWRTYGKFAIWPVLAGFGMTLLGYQSWQGDPIKFLKVGFISAIMWTLMWIGNDRTSHLLTERISWTKEPVKRLVAGTVMMILVTLIVVYIAMGLYYLLLGIDLTGDLGDILYVSLGISTVISMFLHGRSFLYSWRQEAVNAERLLQEGLKSQFESLKSQVNPHFLFNSLNALTNLVHEDPDRAVKFIKQLSEVYRYVLYTRDRDLVQLEEELKFLDSYLFLQRIRFGNKLDVEIDLKGDQQVAPLVLQMLIENAIKHNVVSDEHPLRIRLFQQNDWVVVENNRLAKRTLPEESTGVGLANIKSRYAYFSDKPVQVETDNGKFSVKLPVIAPAH
jgi:sensor histidine kinase YesM